jgi:tRNA-specific 2-thiouridylase
MFKEIQRLKILSRVAKDRVVVGMSGGVDSSVAATLLKDQGYEVIGVMLRLWSDTSEENRCCAPEAQIQARQVADQLDIPFYVMDAQVPFYKSVVEPFINAYAQGLTPNPCLNCNQFIRWGFLQKHARNLDATFIATGHYARIKQDLDGKYLLYKNPDPEKDQSYFLHILSQKDLSRTLFPLAEITKTKVRQLAELYQLSVATRPDSQDLCFVGQGDYRSFIRKMDPTSINPGPILDIHGDHLGEHTGLADYTIGQRKGLRIAGPEPYYVVQKDIKNNTLVIGPRSSLGTGRFFVHQPNWISGDILDRSTQVDIKIRYKAKPVPGTIKPWKEKWAEVIPDNPLPDVTPGQSAVFYQEELCLGGGIIHLEEA